MASTRDGGRPCSAHRHPRHTAAPPALEVRLVALRQVGLSFRSMHDKPDFCRATHPVFSLAELMWVKDRHAACPRAIGGFAPTSRRRSFVHASKPRALCARSNRRILSRVVKDCLTRKLPLMNLIASRTTARVARDRLWTAAVLLILLALAGCDALPALDEGTSPEPAPRLPTRLAGIPTAAGGSPALSSTVTASATRKPARTPTRTPVPQRTQDFDFYVLALSWSPDYCATDGSNDTQQCSPGRKLGFVLHGLWPQYEKGYPSNCSSEKLPDDVRDEFPNLYPSPALYDHEWEKHGTCSGLSPAEYLALSKTLKGSVDIPAAYVAPAQPFRTTAGDLKAGFVGSNPEIGSDGLAVYCSGSGRYLQQLYVCFSVDGEPTVCSAELLKGAARSCPSSFLVRNVR